LTQVAKNHFALYGKYSLQTMIFWYLYAFIWFKNIEKTLLHMTSGFIQLESTIVIFFGFNLQNQLIEVCVAYDSPQARRL
jgi:hypothetical protein